MSPGSEMPRQAAITVGRPDLATLAAVIGHSQIVVARQVAQLPAGFDDVDVAILDWIASEGLRSGRVLVRM